MSTDCEPYWMMGQVDGKPSYEEIIDSDAAFKSYMNHIILENLQAMLAVKVVWLSNLFYYDSKDRVHEFFSEN